MLTADLQSLLTVIVAGFIAPVVVLQLTGRQARAARKAEAEQARSDKERDWQRQDEVAAKAAAVAAAAAEAQRVALERTEQASRAAAETAKVTAAVAREALETQQHTLAIQKEAIDRTRSAAELAAAETADIKLELNVIHHLANSALTAARQSELDAVEESERRLQQNIQRTADLKLPVDSRDADALIVKQVRIKELKEILAERAAVMKLVEREQQAAKTVKDATVSTRTESKQEEGDHTTV